MLKSLFYSRYGFKLVHYLEYFTILFIATEAELDLGLTLGSSWFLEGDQIYSYETCAWLSPPSCLTAKPSSLKCVLLEMLYGISQLLQRNRSVFLQCLGRNLCLHRLSLCQHETAAKLFPARVLFGGTGGDGQPCGQAPLCSVVHGEVGEAKILSSRPQGAAGTTALPSHQHLMCWVLDVMRKERAWDVMPFR